MTSSIRLNKRCLTWYALLAIYLVQCVILAGGRGLRMRPLTEHVPKHLLPVHDIPFARYQLDWLARHGVQRVTYCLGAQGDQIRAFVKDGAPWGLPISYVEDGATLRGTAGALRRALEANALDEAFLVLYGDSFLPIDFREVWEVFNKQPLPALMTVLRHDPKWEVGNVEYCDGIVRCYRKSRVDTGMPYVDYGLSAYRRDMIAERVLPGVFQDLAALQAELAGARLLAGFEVSQRFYEIGSPSGMKEFALWVAQQPAPV